VAVIEPSVRRAAGDPAEAWVSASDKGKIKNGNVMKNNRRKG
jgi:hypothetical protein